MEILYMGYYCDEEYFDKLWKGGLEVSHAAHQLEKNILQGLKHYSKYNKVCSVSYIPFDKNNYIKCASNTDNIIFLYCNKRSISSIITALIKNVLNIYRWSKGKDEKIILMYSVNPLHAIPSFLLRRFCNFKVVTLSSEVSVFRRKNKFNIISNFSHKISNLLDNDFDGYILLTEYMNEVINKNNKPFIVMEGIATEFGDNANDVESRKRAIMYAGGLSFDNGICNLLSAFMEIEDKSCELWIYGDGECRDTIIECSRIDSRIKYFGLVSSEVIHEMERKALLLVNPRLTSKKLFRYSFPSKLLEYMSSGTPLITTKLPGIPKEYYDYIYAFDDDSKEGLLKALRILLNTSEDILKKKGNAAKLFVQENKSYLIQGKRIIEFLERIQENETH